jgi:hypothetical protein
MLNYQRVIPEHIPNSYPIPRLPPGLPPFCPGLQPDLRVHPTPQSQRGGASAKILPTSDKLAILDSSTWFSYRTLWISMDVSIDMSIDISMDISMDISILLGAYVLHPKWVNEHPSNSQKPCKNPAGKLGDQPFTNCTSHQVV